MKTPYSSLPLNSKIYVAGHKGLVGRALVEKLKILGYKNLVTRTRQELDLREQSAVREFFAQERPRYVFLAAAKVGGIGANTAYPAQFICENLTIATNVIEAAHQFQVCKLLNLGSSCVYPRLAPQPMREEALLSGPLEPTNRAYAIAKIAAIELCDAYRVQHGCDFISAMPTNLYGPGDNFDLKSSHVLPALMRRMVEAKENDECKVMVWGSGRALREFLYIEDFAEACLFLMQEFSAPGPINVGTGEDITISDVASLIREVVGYQGKLIFDTSKPDGTPRKLLDVSRLTKAGWRAKTVLREGISKTWQWYSKERQRLEH